MPRVRLRPVLRVRRGLAAVAVLTAAAAIAWIAPPAVAAWAGSDPSSNFAAQPSCSGAVQCLDQAIHILDSARADLGQPHYRLPGNFSQLTPAEQAFVLTDLDRKLYGLAPITGLTNELDQAAAAGVQSADDPHSADPDVAAFTSNWARGYRNMPLAYEGWMYDDGPGSSNFDCTPLTPSGCWIHRHDILWVFNGSGALAMGAAAGSGPGGTAGYALLLVQGTSAYHPTYTYTWSDAVAAGAGMASGAQAPRSSPRSRRRRIQITWLRVHRHTIRFHVVAPRRVALACALTRLRSRHAHFRPCRRSGTYSRVPRGRYRLRVRGGHHTVGRYIRVR